MLVGQSLNAASTTGPGAEITFDKPHAFATLQFTVSPSETASIALEGTLDGSTWTALETIGGVSNSGWITPAGTGNQAVLGVRANLTAISGGTVTAYVAVA